MNIYDENVDNIIEDKNPDNVNIMNGDQPVEHNTYFWWSQMCC